MTSLGAYVLGALDDRERDRVDDHVAACAQCRSELEALIPVRSYLARVSAEELLAPDAPVPPPTLKTRLRTAVRAERRRAVRRRVATVAALAAVVRRPWSRWPSGGSDPLAAGRRPSRAGRAAADAAHRRPRDRRRHAAAVGDRAARPGERRGAGRALPARRTRARRPHRRRRDLVDDLYRQPPR